LRRAEKRGKTLPRPLELALRMVVRDMGRDPATVKTS
jgi:hypothetical protein